MKKLVNIIDVTARDGLQNLKKIIPVEKRIDLVNKLSESGIKHIEFGSYVSPKLHQMKNSLEVYSKINRKEGIKYTILVPSSKKFIEMEQNDIKPFPHISTITAASETFTQKNMNMNIYDSIDNIHSISSFKQKYNFWLRTYISCCFGCPFEGEISLKILNRIINLLPLTVDEIVISDTIGQINLDKMKNIYSLLNSSNINKKKFTLHVHCTDKKIPLIIDEALKNNIYNFDVSLSKLGGCPSAGKEINYNMNAIKTIEYLEKIGFETNINKENLIETEKWLNNIIKE